MQLHAAVRQVYVVVITVAVVAAINHHLIVVVPDLKPLAAAEQLCAAVAIALADVNLT